MTGFWPISTSLLRDQAPHPISIWIPTPPDHVSYCPWWHCHLWPMSRVFLRRLPISKDTQWSRFVWIWRRRPCLRWQTFHSLSCPLYFWCCCLLVRQNPTSLYRPLKRLRSSHLLLSHQNGPIDPTHLTKPWLSSIWCSKYHIWW